VSLKLPLAPAAYDKGDQAQMRGAVERADQQNRKRREDLVLAPGERLVFYDEHGAEQHFTGAVLGGLVRSDTALQGLSPSEQANARANIAAGSVSGTPGGSDGQVQYNNAGGFGGFTLGGDATLDVATGALTLAAVNADTGTFGDGTHAGQFIADAKGRITGASNVAIAFPVTAFNGRTGAIGLTSADVTTALGYAPGTATSVGLSAPAIFTVSASPVTTSGTLALALASQGANTVLAGPASGAAAAPAFRALASADLPLGSTSQAGAVQADGATITASGGVISAAPQSGRLIAVRYFNSGSAATYTPTAGTNSVVIELQAGGGGGSGVAGPNSGSNAAVGAGGGGGGWLRVYLTTNFGGGTYTIGAGGAGGAAGNNNGNTGGNTTFTTSGGSPLTYAVSGGAGGGHTSGGVTQVANAALGGSGNGGGDVYRDGGGSGYGVAYPGPFFSYGGFGGFSVYSAGSIAPYLAANPGISSGNNATGYGGGGSGAVANGATSSTAVGGNGSGGLMIVWEYR
jgi:hypothetical protein